MRNLRQPHACPTVAGEGHFRERYGESAFAQVVTGANMPGLNGLVQRGKRALGRLHIDARHLPRAGRSLPLPPVTNSKCEPASSSFVCPI